MLSYKYDEPMVLQTSMNGAAQLILINKNTRKRQMFSLWLKNLLGLSLKRKQTIKNCKKT